MLSREFVTDINEWVQWYNYHRQTWDNMDLEKKVQFQQKAIYGLFKVVAAMADEIARIDGSPRKAGGSPLILPLGVRQ